MANMTFPYYLFGIYVIELGKFLRDRFKSFSVAKDDVGNDINLQAQVFFGTPRAAFRYYFQKFNNVIKLPMINYHMASIDRKPEFEPLVNIYTVDRENQVARGMRAPGVFNLTYAVNFFNNSYRERDYMLHKLFTAFPKGECHLIYFPDPINHKDIFLQMPHTIDVSVQDITELEGLDPKETRDIIKTSLTIQCNHAFLPMDYFEIPVVTAIGYSNTVQHMYLEGTINDIVTNNKYTFEYVNWLKTANTINPVAVTIPEVTINIT